MPRAQRPLATLRAIRTACAALMLLVGCLLASPDAMAQGEAAAMDRIYQACRDSGGTAANNYNDWVAQNGCICGGVASGAQTCAATTSAAVSSANAQLINSSAQGLVQGIATGDAQLTSMGLLGIIVADALAGDPAADAERARQAAQAAEQQRRVEQMRQQEHARQLELSRQRILGAIKESSAPSGLTVKVGDAGAPINVALTQGAFGSSQVVPVKLGPGNASGELALKLGDAPAQESDRAGQGFDTAGPILGGELPPPPPSPEGRLMEDKAHRITGLKFLLGKNESEAHALGEKLAALQSAPTPDPAAIANLQEQITTNDTQKQKLMLDLSAEDPDAPAHDPASAEPDAAPPGDSKAATH